MGFGFGFGVCLVRLAKPPAQVLRVRPSCTVPGIRRLCCGCAD